MKVRPLVSAIALSAGLLSLAQSAQAADSWLSTRLHDHAVTARQIDSVQVGESYNDVVKSLGQPESLTTWADGSRSAVYETQDGQMGIERVYVNLNGNGAVKSIEVHQL